MHTTQKDLKRDCGSNPLHKAHIIGLSIKVKESLLNQHNQCMQAQSWHARYYGNSIIKAGNQQLPSMSAGLDKRH